MEIDREKIERSVRLLLAGIGENPKREGLFGTPGRIAAFFEEFLGLRDTFESVRKLFQVESDGRYVLLDIPFYSLCEHHFLPFYGKASMAYEVSQKRVLGLRKFMRLRLCTGHLQLQEHLAEELANALVKATDGGSVLILLEAEHLCTRMRWLRSEGACYVTRALRGNFAGDTALLSDMLAMIRLGRTGL